VLLTLDWIDEPDLSGLAISRHASNPSWCARSGVRVQLDTPDCKPLTSALTLSVWLCDEPFVETETLQEIMPVCVNTIHMQMSLQR
jgi:hypothetical protein